MCGADKNHFDKSFVSVSVSFLDGFNFEIFNLRLIITFTSSIPDFRPKIKTLNDVHRFEEGPYSRIDF